ILFFAAVSLNFANGTVENLMHQANNLYQENQYDEAIKIYKKILEEGYESESVHFNLGNCYFRINKLGYAILNYEKALRLAPDDEDINYNLLIAKARTVDKIKELPKLFIVEWWEVLVTSLSANNWLLLILIFYYLLLLTIAGYFLIRRFNFQKYLAYWGMINFIILIILSSLLFARLNREASTDFGILVESTITVKQSPSEKGNDVFVIHEGIKFEIEDRLDNWAKIKLADGKVGWLPEESFEKI
ncbi:tetratricopeptide repeat protein, partial [Bacteroidota bacterium]